MQTSPRSLFKEQRMPQFLNTPNAQRKRLPLWAALLCLAWSALLSGGMLTSRLARAQEPPPMEEIPRRELYVPIDQLQVLLEGAPRRIFMPREQYEDLLAKAQKDPHVPAPVAVALTNSSYTAAISEGRATVQARIDLEVFERGLHVVDLPLAQLGVQSVTLDGEPASLALANNIVLLFVSGVGRHTLEMELLVPVTANAASQSLPLVVPVTPATVFQLSVPGNVELKSGADVISRSVNAEANETRFELALPKGPTTLSLSLNNKLRGQQQLVVARSVLLDEVTEAYERLQAVVSFEILHGAADKLQIVVPAGFEVMDVRSPLLTSWEVQTQGDLRVLELRLQEPQTGFVVAEVVVEKANPELASWTFPSWSVQGVNAQVALLGLAVDRRLDVTTLVPESLVRMDNAVLSQASSSGTAVTRAVVAYFAPQADWKLAGSLVRPETQLNVTTNALLVLSDADVRVSGGFVLAPLAEELFEVRFSVPNNWQLIRVNLPDGTILPHELRKQDDGSQIARVKFPQGVPPRSTSTILFEAQSTPADWLGRWEKQLVAFPVFSVLGATRDLGAVAVQAQDDLEVQPEATQGLTPLGETEKAQYGLESIDTQLAFRYQAHPYSAQIAVERRQPRLTVHAFQFFRVAAGELRCHYELTYDVSGARTRQVKFRLPNSTPEAIAIVGLKGQTVAETSNRAANGDREWTVLLAEEQSETVHLAVTLVQPAETESGDLISLPLIRAEEVDFQTGTVAVEGHAEFDVEVAQHPRRIDIGELAQAEYQTSRHLVGAFGYLGQPPEMSVRSSRHEGYQLPAAIVERAEILTAISADEIAQTAARFQLRSKASFLEVRLPAGAVLWSAALNGQPSKPQREKDRLLLSLPTGDANRMHDLVLVYENVHSEMGLTGEISLDAPQLWLSYAEKDDAREVPLADLVWYAYLPPGYRVTRTHGTVFLDQSTERPMPWWQVAGAMYFLGGGVHGPSTTFEAVAPASDMAVATRSGGAAGDYDYRYTPGIAPPQTSETPMYEGYAVNAEPSGMAQAQTMPAEPMQPPSAIDEMPMAPGGEGGNRFRETPTEGDQPSDAYAAAGEKSDLDGDGVTDRQVWDDAATFAGRREGEANANGTANPYPTNLSLATPRYDPVTQGRFDSGMQRPATPQSAGWILEGLRSLKIELQPAGEPVTFRSLGAGPQLRASVVHASRLRFLGMGLALAVLLWGIRLTWKSVKSRAAFVVGVLLAASLLPLVPAVANWAEPLDMMFYAGCALVPYYLIVSACRAICRSWKSAAKTGKAAVQPAAASLALLLALGVSTRSVSAQEMGPPAPTVPGAVTVAPGGEYLVVPLPIGPAVSLPDNVIVIPFDPTKGDPTDSDRLLVPYSEYVNLWNLAFPDQPLDEALPPYPFAISGAKYQARLQDGDSLLITGTFAIESFTKDTIYVPLPMTEGVVERATSDGKPALLQVSTDPANAGQLVWQVQGKGRKELQLTIRYKLIKAGGWRRIVGTLPAAPATRLTLTVPDAQTEVRLAGAGEIFSTETANPEQQLEATTGFGGLFQVEWRTKVAAGQVDQSLTAESMGVLDVQEDGLRLFWRLSPRFRGNQRDTFTLKVPAGFLIERVSGPNVRGWKSEADGDRQSLEVTLLAPAKDTETLFLELYAPRPVLAQGNAEFSAPSVQLDGAALHQGTYSVRLSPWLDLRVGQMSGLQRAEISSDAIAQLVGTTTSAASPIGVRVYQAFQFSTPNFQLPMTVEPLPARLTAKTQAILRIARRDVRFESRLEFEPRMRPTFGLRIVLPLGLEVESVQLPCGGEWSVTDLDKASLPMDPIPPANPPAPAVGADTRKVLVVILEQGQTQPFALSLSGRLPDRQADVVEIPNLQVHGAESQRGELAILLDPGYDLRGENLRQVSVIPLERVQPWLQAQQYSHTRVAMETRDANYSGQLRLQARTPQIKALTVTNLRITDRAIEETVLIQFAINEAGIRELSFLLPAYMRSAHIQAPLLRRKSFETLEAPNNELVRVRLELQDDIMGELRVLVENDRLLTNGPQMAPLVQVETGETLQQFVTLESAGRDEVLVEQQPAFEPLSRGRQRQWDMLTSLLQIEPTQAYAVKERNVRFAFRTQDRTRVDTVGARIGLAEAALVLDGSGAYRCQQQYHVDNATEQFLEVQLPVGAELWAVRVAGELVKPTVSPGATQPGIVRIPLVKTAAGDRDYLVNLKFGGLLGSLNELTSVTFPLPRTVNIQVEQSHVRLYLPETHRWLRFSGTMRRIEDQAEVAAGYLSYQNEQLRKLSKVLEEEDTDSFANVRARFNAKELAGEVRQYLDQNKGLWASGSSKPGVDLGEAVREAQQTESSLQELEGKVSKSEIAQSQTATADNRYQFEEVWRKQQYYRSNDTVNDLGGNFMAVPGNMPAAEGMPQQQLEQDGETKGRIDQNYTWLEKNKLGVSIRDEPQVLDGADKKMTLDFEQQQAGQTEFGTQTFQSQSRELFGNLRGGKQQVADEESAAKGGQRRASRGQQALVQEYAESLQQGQPANGAANSSPDESAPTATQPSDEGSVSDGRGFAAPGGMGGGGGGFGGSSGPPVQGLGANGPPSSEFQIFGRPPAQLGFDAGGRVEAGLVSLDVEFPVRGTLYEFTTPRGDTEITAMAVQDQTAKRWWRAACMLIGLLVAFVLYRIGGKLPWHRLNSMWGGIALAVLGLVLLLLCVFPIVGLVCVACGTPIAMFHAFVARQARKAEETPDFQPV